MPQKSALTSLLPTPSSWIIEVRGHRVILDSTLASLYKVPTKRLNEAIKRNRHRFPDDFMFQLTEKEALSLRSQIATSKSRGGRRYLPYVFTEHETLMAANVLNSPRATAMSVEIVRAFIRLRQMSLSVEGLARKIRSLEQKYNSQFKVVFDAIRQLMIPPEPPKRKIGFITDDNT